MSTHQRILIQEGDFDVAAEYAAARARTAEREATAAGGACGAIASFVGLVRDQLSGPGLEELFLEHYPGMTEAELARVEAAAHERWPLQGTTIIHRIGDLAPGDNIVLVVAASRHRHAAFEAAEFLMDYLKSKAPFWKKETGVDGNGAWVDARESDEDALGRWQQSS